MTDVCDTVVLDVDGTLVDSVYLHVDIWARALAQVGLSVPSWRIHRSIGMGGDRLITELVDQAAEDAHGDEVRRLHDDEFGRRLESVEPLPGAADLLAALARRPVKVVVASSGAPGQTERLLDLVGGPDALHAVITSGDADESKPAPDLLEVAVGQVDGRRALVVGDAVWDVEAAVAAGHPCVGLRSGGFGEAELREAGAAWVYDDPQQLVEHLDELPLPR